MLDIFCHEIAFFHTIHNVLMKRWVKKLICGLVSFFEKKLQSNLYYPDLDYPDFFSGPNLVMIIY